MERPKRILIVCGGNTCRSPMAKVILEQTLISKGLEKQFKVDSAAFNKPDGTSANPNARQVIMEMYGADLLVGHKPKMLTKAMADESDLILVMEDYMKGGLLSDKDVIVLGISDPFGGNMERYRVCAAEIKKRFEEIWSQIVGLIRSSQNPRKLPTASLKPLVSKPPAVSAIVADNLQEPVIQPRITSSDADWVFDEVLIIAKKVDYGRGTHPKTVTRLMLNMYDDMKTIGLINDTADKRKLAEIAGLSHDIGVSISETCHNVHGFKMLRKELWNEGLSSSRKQMLAIVMYAVYYHRSPILDGYLNLLEDIPFKDYRTTAEFVSLLRIADGLDYGEVKSSPDKVEKVEMVRTSKGVECRVFPRPGENVAGLVAKSYEKREVFEANYGELTFWLPNAPVSWILCSKQKR